MSAHVAMPDASPIPSVEDPGAVDPRLVHAEEIRCMLRRLAEIGMEMTQALARQVLSPGESAQDAAGSASPPPPVLMAARDPADAFARLSRAVRLTLGLEIKVDNHLAALRAGTDAASGPAAASASRPASVPAGGSNPPASPGVRDSAFGHSFDDQVDLDDFAPEGVELTYRNSRPLPWDHPSAFRNQVRDAVVEVINHEIDDYYRAPRLLDDLYERLWEGERYDAFVYRPLDEVVAAICADLGIEVDRSRWKPDREVTENGVTTLYRGHRDWTSSWKPMGSMLPRRRLYRRGQDHPPQAGASP